MAWPFRRREEDDVKKDDQPTFAEAVLRLHTVGAQIDEQMAALLRDVREKGSPKQPRPER